MSTTIIFNINLQQGFFVDPKNNYIVGAYSHHNRQIFVKIPYKPCDIDIPEVMKDYEVIEKATDSFCIQAWTTTGYKDLELSK